MKLPRTLISLGLGLATTSPAWALGEILIDSSGFLRESSQRPSSSSFLILGPQYEKRGKWVEGAADVKAYAYLLQSASLTAEAKNLYLATSRDLSQLPGQQVSLGRRTYDWSVADEVWNLGMWQPRFLWDPLRPTQVGLFGAFYSLERSHFRLLAFASPIAIPERGNSIYQERGQLRSFGPWWNPLPSSVEMKLGGQTSTLPIEYQLNYPSIKSSLLRPGAAVHLRVGDPKRFWGSLAYGVLPVHQIDMAVDVGLKPSAESSRVLASIYPRFLVHQLLTAESSFHGRFWSVFASVTGESPLGASRSIPSDWLYTPVGPSLVSSFGGTLTWREGLKLSASVLSVTEKPAARTAMSGIDINLQGRFPYQSAAQVQAKWEHQSDFSYQVGWTYDGGKDSSLVSTQITYRPGWMANPERARLTLGVGADLINSATGKGWIGQYVGNDRFRGSVGYAF